MAKQELTLFDDPKLVRLEQRIAEHRTKTINAVLQTGKVLAMANEVLAEKGKNGRFWAWVDERCDISKANAQRYMRTYALFGEQPTLQGNVSLRAIEYLAGDVPPEAVEKVIEMARSGESVWLPQAKEVVKCVSVSAGETTTSENEPHVGRSSESAEEDAEEQNIEKEEPLPEEPEEEEKSIEDTVAEHNRDIESFCRAIHKAAKEKPDVSWLDHKGRWDGYLRKIKQGLDTLRSAKAVMCPACKGEAEGCSECEEYGYLPKVEAESISA